MDGGFCKFSSFDNKKLVLLDSQEATFSDKNLVYILCREELLFLLKRITFESFLAELTLVSWNLFSEKYKL